MKSFCRTVILVFICLQNHIISPRDPGMDSWQKGRNVDELPHAKGPGKCNQVESMTYSFYFHSQYPIFISCF